MLVYVNTIQITGEDSFHTASRAIHGWLMEKLGSKLTLNECFEQNEWKSGSGRDSTWIKSYISKEIEPAYYAWKLKHSDSLIQGRQWLIEISLTRESNITTLSCSVKTDEQSTLVTKPALASRPRLIGYLLETLKKDKKASLAANTVGKKLKKVKKTDDYKGLLAEIESTQRNYPLVIISPTKDKDYLINRQHAQDSLIGLAQIIEIDKEYDSYEMESILGKKYSAWDGAINIIPTAKKNGQIYPKLILSQEAISFGEKQSERIERLLAYVTHQTNIPKIRGIITPETVLQKSLKRRLEKLKSSKGETENDLSEENALLWEENETLTNSVSGLKAELEQEALEKEYLQEKLGEMELEIQRQLYRNQAEVRKSKSPITQQPIYDSLVELIIRDAQPTARECLDYISGAYQGRVIVLESAQRSAEEYNLFENGNRLLHLLHRLCTTFYEALVTKGDSEARKIFSSDEYSATESKSTQNNSTAKNRRTFTYKENRILMLRHLKIGKADDKRLTIRVYFEWLPDEQVIVIGHCGEHLPVISH
ncbi:hypothetical protein QN096_14540 [Metapseudomonas otitidis]|uniref:hypothetical protein n=1 Tax=Metapseudomonas otitidis TaxID=319939 RepID=UPI00254166F3|nr:hypothetical protein [Pseudomonas otitidis]WIF65005.1 hypothetical protein QN096_14540 [Pseudomonas otitidis]